jgi:CRISPR-associated endonuclease Cas1
MHAQPSATPSPWETRIFPDPGRVVRVVDGYGVRVRVHHGRLQVEDGIGRQRRSVTYARATCPFRRLLILGHTGYISLEAIRWCWDLGVGIVQVDTDRNLLLTSARREVATNRLRRVQALAPYTELGVETAQLVMRTKLGGQQSVARDLVGDGTTASTIGDAVKAVEAASTLDDVLAAESTAAFAYWDAWSRLPLRFVGRGSGEVPELWLAFGTRSSPVSGTRRHAANPANALLNYAYALLEAETTLALHASGLDPALGIWHRDEAGRNSLSLDVMEAARPAADRLVLQLLADGPLRPRDFHETRQGACRVLSPLSHHLATWMSTLAGAVEPTVLQLGQLLDRAIRVDPTPSIRLTRSRRSEHRRAPTHPRPATSTLRRCRTCGVVLPENRRDAYCADCAPNRATDARAAQDAEARRLDEERKASEQAAYATYLASIPKFEYKVLTLSSTIWASAGKFDGGGLQKTLNQQAAEGWRVIEIAMSGKIEKAFSADRNDMYVVFERPGRG